MILDSDAIGTLGNQIVLIISAVGTLVGVITTAILTIRNGRKSDEIHKLVNGNTSALATRNDKLTELLSTTDIIIPADLTKETEQENG